MGAADAGARRDPRRACCRNHRSSATTQHQRRDAEQDQRDDAQHARAELARGDLGERRHGASRM